MDKKQVIGWFIILTMVLSAVGYVADSLVRDNSVSTGEIDYNGYKFYPQGNGWKVNLRGTNYQFQYLPSELENISLSADISSWWSEEKIYLAYDPDDPLDVQAQLQFINQVLFNSQLTSQLACTQEKGCPDIPIIDCQQKTGLILVSGKENDIVSEERCVKITVIDTLELTKYTERLIYTFLGVMS
ncbi:hypothetical protein HYX12_01365 [Candidatus Woesearchaeota archaeon]|nr:hypothetical protein [Candidatus Woesearchaeota archaeon]